MDGSKIIFNGSGNILVIEDGVRLDSSTVLFNGSNADAIKDAQFPDNAA